MYHMKQARESKILFLQNNSAIVTFVYFCTPVPNTK